MEKQPQQASSLTAEVATKNEKVQAVDSLIDIINTHVGVKLHVLIYFLLYTSTVVECPPPTASVLPALPKLESNKSRNCRRRKLQEALLRALRVLDSAIQWA